MSSSPSPFNLKGSSAVSLVPNSESLQSELSKLSSSLKYLTINGWVPESDLTDFKSLETIKILTKVDPRFKSQIDSLKIKKMVVTYESPPDIPDEPNLIFDLLNDDCILEIHTQFSHSAAMDDLWRSPSEGRVGGNELQVPSYTIHTCKLSRLSDL